MWVWPVGPDVKGTPTIAYMRCNSRSLIFLTASTQQSDFEARHPRAFGCSLIFPFNKGEDEWCRCVHIHCLSLSLKIFLVYTNGVMCTLVHGLSSFMYRGYCVHDPDW